MHLTNRNKTKQGRQTYIAYIEVHNSRAIVPSPGTWVVCAGGRRQAELKLSSISYVFECFMGDGFAPAVCFLQLLLSTVTGYSARDGCIVHSGVDCYPSDGSSRGLLLNHMPVAMD
jgi:hypothetical protein